MSGTAPAGVHLVTRMNKDGEPVRKYEMPRFLSFDSDAVDGMRRDAVVRRDEFVLMQKEFASAGDRTSAKWAKDEASDALKEYRASCLVLGHLVCDPPGDSRFKAEWEWPVELAPWIDRVVRKAAA